MAARTSRQTDVVIVGSGAVGVAAGLEAQEAGAQVIVIEKEAQLGGAAAISSGGCCCVGTRLQREQGIADSPDLAFEDWIRWGEGAADEAWARFYIEHSRADLYQWGIARGVQWDGLMQPEGNSVPRWHQPTGGGAGLWHALYQHARARGLTDWITSMAAHDLIVEHGRVTGVVAVQQETGEEQAFLARAVILGTGGFASNLDMVYQYRPDLRRHRVLEGSHVGATGDGHKMVQRLGGVLTHMEDIWFYVYAVPDHRDPRHRRGLVVRDIPDAVWVNMQGIRFHNEDLTGGASGSRAVMAQEPAECWAIIDSIMAGDLMVSDPSYYVPGTSHSDPAKVQALLHASPHIKRAPALDELGAQLGVPSTTFVETISQYNRAIDDGLTHDPACQRPLQGRKPIAVPPFYALHYVPLARKNFGGVKTNRRCQVLDKHYEPMPGLYAAGELTGMAGGHINGKAGLEGTMLGPALFSGRVAGAWAAYDAGYGQGFVGQADRR
jgi:flavocytochrome c